MDNDGLCGKETQLTHTCGCPFTGTKRCGTHRKNGLNLSESLRGKRGMRVHYALTLGILGLSGCSYGLDEAVASLDKGVSGYEGQVTPLSRPYLLRLEEGPDPPYRYTKISDLSGSTERTSMVIRTKIWAKGGESGQRSMR